MKQKILSDKFTDAAVFAKGAAQIYKIGCGRALENYNGDMKPFAFLTLTYLLIAAPLRQAMSAETTHDFGKWEPEITAFKAADRTNPPPTNALLFVGSSTIRLWTTLATDFPGHPIINHGFGGSEIADSTHFADRIVFPYAPRAIFFRAGGNDLANGKTPEAVFVDFKAFVETVHARLPDVEIYFISWNPTPSRWKNREKEKTLNDSVEEYARHTPRVKFIEAGMMVIGADGMPRPELFIGDQLHFNAAGYKLLAERVRPFLPK